MSALGSDVANSSRVSALQKRHHLLEQQIEEAQRSPSATDFYLRSLKKQKLALKEKIEGIREGSATA